MNRLRMIAALMKNDTEQVQAIKMFGLHYKDLLINPLSIGQTIGLMQPECFGQERRKICRFPWVRLGESLLHLVSMNSRFFLLDQGCIHFFLLTSGLD